MVVETRLSSNRSPYTVGLITAPRVDHFNSQHIWLTIMKLYECIIFKSNGKSFLLENDLERVHNTPILISK